MTDKEAKSKRLSPEHISDIRLAASKMPYIKRRAFQAEIATKHCNGSPRKAEKLFGWSRDAVELGLHEKRTGIICLGTQPAFSGRPLWEEKHPELAKVLQREAEAHAQQDPTFQSTIAYTRLTAKAALHFLRSQDVEESCLPSLSTMGRILNRIGFRLRRVVKAKPLKKIKETNAIFENIKKKDEEAKNSNVIKRLSVDCKATVKTGEHSRGGLTRGENKASDHDFKYNGKYVPCGILDEDTGQLHITFGTSYKTSDFIVDSLESKWDSLDEQEKENIELLQLKIDNGPESSGVRTQFLARMVQFSEETGVPVQLLYFPPYHSKYNPIERCWGVLEIHWNGAILRDQETMLEWAKTMTWRGLSPIIELSNKAYQKGISLGKKAMRVIESQLERCSALPKWDILVFPSSFG